MVVVSPGVPLDLPFIEKLYELNKEIIGEVELAYRLSKNPTFIGITGTNGKTTTTTLVGEIFKKANKDTYVTGNIGAPVIDKEKVSDGVYLDEDNNIIIDIDEKIVLLNKEEISLPGNHNLENCMAAIAMSYVCGIDLDVISETLKTFGGVEHRQEFVKTLHGVTYINDSKGTNPDSSIKALESYKNPIVLIAGGMDKGSSF